MADTVWYGWKDAEATSTHDFLVPPFMSVLRKHCNTPARVIDLGCGNGAVTNIVRGSGYDVAGLDSSPDGIDHARAKWPELTWLCKTLDEPLENFEEQFDAAYSLEVIEHMFQPRNLFRRAKDLVRPGGCLIISTPYHGYWKNLALSLFGSWDRHLSPTWDGGHIKFFSPATLKSLAAEMDFGYVESVGVGRIVELWKSMIYVFRIP